MPTYFSSGGFSSISSIFTRWAGMLNRQFRLNETLDIQRFRHIVPYKPFILNFVKKTQNRIIIKIFHFVASYNKYIKRNEEIFMLTNREKEVLKLLAKGYTNPEIAQMLYISPHTVKAHVAAILKKLNVKNRLLAVVAAEEYLNKEE